ncbi:molybdopterin-dependent oxidoreductase [Kocuria flava]|uniref:molybdopterin-dependent oxidoreductase n=1 Tax=Kocuria flava TaxID=446860 RepID=UPI001FF273C4|nr:molybdopterin-dependent oxidoreductase [Kocuria flava]MCJ8504595.1 molybdopterin-dependent oxidoreductase [Kocuria flava]
MSTDPAGGRRAPWWLLGLGATAVAVGTAELLAWVTGPVGAPLTAVGGVLVDAVPAPVKDAAIALFGTADKLVLLLVMVAGLAGLGAGIGAAQRANRPMGAVLLAVLGLLGLLAVLSRAGAGAADAVPVVAGTAAGVLVLTLLTRAAEPAPEGPAGAGRRDVLTLAVAAAGRGAAAGAAGRWAGSVAARAPAARELLRIPAPAVRERIPPGTDVGVAGAEPWLTPAGQFYRIDTALAVPRIDVAAWRLRIHGLVERELDLDFAQLTARPLLERAVTLACVSNPVGGDLAGNAVWTGVPLRELLAEAGVAAGADMVLSTSEDGFTAGTPLEALTDPDRDALLAVGMNGQPLPFEHGYPVRMVVPGLYGYVSATKWVVDLEVTRFDRAEAYWTVRGWSARGPIKTASRIEVPRQRATVAAGTVVLAGTAWAQHTGIAAVQVSVDGGPWQEAELGAVPSADTWRQWVLRTELGPGGHTARVRAVDADGTVQTGEQAPPAPDGASGWHERGFTVA